MKGWVYKVKKYITCPNLGCLARVSFEESPESSRVLGATGCSLIEGEVDCGQECIIRMNQRRELENTPEEPSKDSPESQSSSLGSPAGSM